MIFAVSSYKESPEKILRLHVSETNFWSFSFCFKFTCVHNVRNTVMCCCSKQFSRCREDPGNKGCPTHESTILSGQPPMFVGGLGAISNLQVSFANIMVGGVGLS